MEDGKVIIKVFLNDEGVSKSVDELDKRIGALEGSGQKASLGLGKIVTALGLVKAASFVFDLIKDSIGAAFNRIDVMEQFERVMTVMTGSAEKANEVLDTTGDIVTGTAYGLDVAALAVQNFVTSNMDVDKATDTVAAWGDAVAFYGDGSNQTFASVSDALAKMSGKGKVSLQEINRLTEAGIPALQIYADKTGKSVEQISKEISAGKIKSEDFIDTMNDALMNGTEKFGSISGAAKDAGASWGASFDNMKAAVARGTIAIIQNIDDMLVSNGLPDMREMVSMFGKALENMLKSAADKIPMLVDAFKNIYNEIKPLLPVIGALAALFVTYQAVMGAVNGIVKIATGVQKLFKLVLSANPVGLVVAGIILLVGAFIYLWKTSDTFREFWINLWEKVKEVVTKAWEGIKSVWSTVGEFFSSAVDSIKSAWDSIPVFFQGIWTSIKEKFAETKTFFSDIWNNVVETTKEKWNSVKTFFSDLWTSIKEIVSLGVQGMVDGIMVILEPFIATFMAIWENIVTPLEDIWNTIQFLAGVAWDLIKTVILAPVLAIVDIVTGDFEGLKSHMSQIWDNIKLYIELIWLGIKEFFKSVLEVIVGIASVLWENLKNNTINIFNTIKEKVIQAATALKDGAVNAWETLKTTVISKAQELKTNAINAWENLKTSVINAARNLKQNAINAWNELKTSVVNAANQLKNDAISAWQSLKETVVSKAKELKDGAIRAWNTLKTKTSEAFNKVANFIKDPLKNVDLYQIGKDIIQGLINGIGSMVTAVKNKVLEVANGIKEKITGALTIKSPSRWMRDKVGKMIPQGIAVGIEADSEDAAKAMRNVSKKVMATNIAPELATGIGRRLSTAKTGVGGVSNSNKQVTNNNTPTIHIDTIVNNTDSDIPRILEQAAWIMSRDKGRLQYE